METELVLVKGIREETEIAEMYEEIGMMIVSEEMMRDAAEDHDPGPDQERGGGQDQGPGIAGQDQDLEKGVDVAEVVTERDQWTFEKKLNRNWLLLKQQIQI